MKNAERIMIDVARVVRDYESGRLNETVAVFEVLDLVNNNCEHCAFLNNNCQDDHKKTCVDGYSIYLRSEA